MGVRLLLTVGLMLRTLAPRTRRTPGPSSPGHEGDGLRGADLDRARRYRRAGQLRPEPDDLVRAGLHVDQELPGGHRLQQPAIARHRRRRADPRRRGGPPPPAGPYEQTITRFVAVAAAVPDLGDAVGLPARRRRQRRHGEGREDEWRALQAADLEPAAKGAVGKAVRVVGYINPMQLVDRVETWIDHPIFGDLHVDTTYIDFQDVGGVKVPTRMSQKQAGMETFVAVITGVRVNRQRRRRTGARVPRRLRWQPQCAPAAASEKLADGVYRITGGYVSLAVEFKDHVVVLESGPSEARALAVIAEVKRLFPAKRIKYVVSTHPHFDHSAAWRRTSPRASPLSPTTTASSSSRRPSASRARWWATCWPSPARSPRSKA